MSEAPVIYCAEITFIIKLIHIW